MCVADRVKINTELYDKVAAGDEQAAQQMMLNNMPYVRWRVDRFLALHPRYEGHRDDLIGSGDLAVVECVRQIASKAIENPTAYLCVGVTNALRDYIRIMISENVAARHLGHPVKIRSLIPSKYQGEAEEVSYALNDILVCCQTEEEVALVCHRAEGYSNRVVSRLLGLPARTVDAMLKGIHDRYQQSVS